MDRVLVTVLEFGVTEAGLKVQPASAGSPLHEKVIGLVNEPCGVTVSVNVPDCPAVTVALLGLGDRVKSVAFTICVSTADVLPALLASPSYVAVIEFCPTPKLDVA